MSIVLGKVTLDPGVAAQTVSVVSSTARQLTAVTDTPGIIIETIPDADGHTVEIRARRLGPDTSTAVVATFTLVEFYP